MIERISEQARQYADENYPGSFVKYDPEWFAFYNKKFAELIVQECANISNQAEKQCQHPGTEIKKHFGVEL
jgi:hypothetical protein